MTTELTAGDAWGLSTDPDRPGSWHLHMLFHPRGGDGLDALTATIAERADAAAEEHDAEVVDVEAREGLTLATFRIAEPDGWFDLRMAMDPFVWDKMPTELDPMCRATATAAW